MRFDKKNQLSFYVGIFLRKSRNEKKLTGRQLGKLMHISQQQISRYETGMTPLTIDQINVLLDLLEKSWVELLLFIRNEYERESQKKINDFEKTAQEINLSNK